MPEEGNTPAPQVDEATIAAIKAAIQPDIEALKSSTNSRFDSLKNSVLDEILPLVEKGDGSKPATEFGKKRDDIASQRERERQAEELQKAKAERDEYWSAYNEAIYVNQFPKEVFEGLTTAAEIKRQTAALQFLKPAGDTTNNSPGGTGRAGAGSPGATDPTEGMDSAEKTYHAINKSFPMQPGVQWQSAGS